MNGVLDPLLLKETSTRGQVAVVYGLIGVVIGALVLGKQR